MGFRCGIVGLPNVGKSTLFNALTQAGIEAANFPFCTIEPNSGMVPVPDPRLDQLTEIVNPQRTIPTTIEFVDIAGLVSGASKGEGLGNKFLAHIREVDAIVHVVRCFAHDQIIHVNGQVDPLGDIETIDTELILADLDSVEKRLARVEKTAKSGDKQLIKEKELLIELKSHLESGSSVRDLTLNEDDRAQIQSFHLLTSKPVMYIANVAEDGFSDNPYLQKVQELAKQQGAEVVAVCNTMEEEMLELDESERQLFLEEMGLAEPGLNRVIRAGYKLLGLQTFFTAGVKEVRAWTVKKGSLAPKAAAVIHTDFERGFIRAQVIGFDDFVRYQGEQGAKEHGRLRVEGKDYLVADGDIIHFRFNV